MISAASASAITPVHTPSSNPFIFWQSAEDHAIFHPKEGETVLEGIEQQINVLHEALSSHLIARISLCIKQYPSGNKARFCSLHYHSPLTIRLCGKIGTNVVRLPLALPQKWELHHLEIQEW
jgi:hypothetical protein